MFIFDKSLFSLLVPLVLWRLGCSHGAAARPGAAAWGPAKDHLDPNTRDWGDYSDLQGLGHGLGLDRDGGPDQDKEGGDPSSSLAPELDFLANFAGKKRLWVITAPSHNDHYLRMMEKQLEDMEQEGLNCRLAERDTFIVIIIQNAMMEGRIQKTTLQGDAMVESLDPDTVSKLLHHLELTNQEQVFSMLVLKKNLRVSERFPYPVRVEAILELIDQFPMRKLEKMTRKGSNLRCKVTKKRVVVKKMKRKMVLGAQRRGNITAVAAVQRRPVPDRKEAVRSKIRDILSGRSRFVIRKVPPAGRKESSGGGGGVREEQEKPGASKPNEASRFELAGEAGKTRHGDEGHEGRAEEQKKNADQQNKNGAKKKGKAKKGKKGKGRGKKSNREASEKDKTALNEFLEALRGKRRLMVISSPSSDATLYVQLKGDNQQRYCDLALRKVTSATILGKGRSATLTLQHHHLDTESPFSDLPEQFSDPDLISLLRAELELSSSDLFSMTVTDYDIKANRVFEAPPSASALLDFIDNFPSRRLEKEKERKSSPVCSKNQPGTDNPLQRFMSKRRLLLISTPTEDDYSFQQQLSALTGQECHMGIRHFALLKMTGVGAKAKGTVELFPLNGRSQSQVEPLSMDAVNSLREELKISRDYFSMLVVGKDGDVKAWFPSPMWSMDNIYDLVDSLELRVQEAKLQRSLTIHCPEDRSGGAGEGGYHGYGEDHAEEHYLYHRRED